VFIHVAGAPLPYTDPWTATFFERRRALVRRARHVAYIYGIPDASTFRYRVLNMIEALDADAELDISSAWFSRDDIRRDPTIVDRADVVVICRFHYEDSIARLIARAHARGTRVLYDIDDLVFNPNYAPLVTQTLDITLLDDYQWNFWFGDMARLGATLRDCDSAIATNPFLAERILEYAPAIPVAVVPNFLNRQQTEVSRVLMARKRATGWQRDGNVEIGYFSGTPTHNRDLLIASAALASILERFANVRLRVVGPIDLNAHLVPHKDRIAFLPLQDYLNLQRLTAEVELSIVPLQSNDFTNCKSELKYFEAGIVGVPTMASPSYTMARAIRDGSNGYTATSPEWFSKMVDVVSLLEEDPAAYEALSERVVAHAETRYAWNGQARVIEAAVFGSTSDANRTDASTSIPPPR
jgi:glycosyltransferase involved in cell wall biosynthesis